jgi:hypothetical protein
MLGREDSGSGTDGPEHYAAESIPTTSRARTGQATLSITDRSIDMAAE